MLSKMGLQKDKEPIQDAHGSKWTVHSNHDIRCFTGSEIERMTNNYETILGKGAYGEVFRGVLEDESEVAVKRFIRNVTENFQQELTVHREINHRNVVRLIGYCKEENALMMVTEYIPNGNLCDALHRGKIPIPLDIRLRIATDCAEALSYMHSHMNAQVIHGDIKPANILLDDSFNAKISDFGVSRLVGIDKTLCTEYPWGSIGYMDIRFARDGRLTVKSDVYSFGVVLFELITRKKATGIDGEVSFLDRFTGALSSGIKGVKEMFDADITNKSNMKILERVAKLAGECLRMETDRRPDMVNLAERLETLRKASLRERRWSDPLSWVWTKMKQAPALIGTNSASACPPPLCHRFTFAEMEAATNSFDEQLILSDCAFGRLYYGEIDGGATKLAVKRCRTWAVHRACQFFAEKETMSKIGRHRHIVPLIGYCYEKNEMMLVYEYMSRNSLPHNMYNIQKAFLTWKRRLEICIGVARALHHLHSSGIIHCNVAMADILLDATWGAKISNLSLCKAGPSTDEIPVGECCGMADPEYKRTGRITEKSDVYCFGVVLLQVLNFQQPMVEHDRVYFAHQIIDTCLLKSIDARSCLKFVQAAEKCVADRGIDRPSMADLISELESALQLQVTAEASGSIQNIHGVSWRQDGGISSLKHF